MDTIQIKDKQFSISIKEEDILKEVKRVADEINRDLKDKNPLFLSVLNGSFMFTADLMKHIAIPCEVSFVKLASYQGVSSTGTIKEVIGINEDIAGRTKNNYIQHLSFYLFIFQKTFLPILLLPYKYRGNYVRIRHNPIHSPQ